MNFIVGILLSGPSWISLYVTFNSSKKVLPGGTTIRGAMLAEEKKLGVGWQILQG
jgi:hypothetical protein